MLHVIRAANEAAFKHALAGLELEIQAIEASLRTGASVIGYCNACESVQSLVVSAGPAFGDNLPNLREGLVCPCGAKNRDRLMIIGSRDAIITAEKVVFFGMFSGWADWVRRTRTSGVTFCEYFPEKATRGFTRTIDRLDVRNEDMTNMTFSNSTFDAIFHQDVLEHIPDYKQALRESLRILRPGGQAIFTAPFFHGISRTIIRAVIREDGSVEHLQPEERHGDPLAPEGILAFYNFSWSLLDDLREAGFVDVNVNMVYSADLALVSNGCPGEGNMLPVYVTGNKLK